MAQRLHSNVELLELTRSIRVSVGGNETGALRETMLADLVLAPKVVLEDTSPADGSMQELPTLQLTPQQRKRSQKIGLELQPRMQRWKPRCWQPSTR